MQERTLFESRIPIQNNAELERRLEQIKVELQQRFQELHELVLEAQGRAVLAELQDIIREFTEAEEYWQQWHGPDAEPQTLLLNDWVIRFISHWFDIRNIFSNVRRVIK